MEATADDNTNPNNITWHPHSLDRTTRWKSTTGGHKGAVLWFTGLSGSGKSSIANRVEVVLHHRGIRTYVLDGDNVRHGLCRDLGFSPSDRTENVRRVGEVAQLMADSGTVVCAAFLSPQRAHRDAIRHSLRDCRAPFVEIYVRASLETCEQRDPKGLYKMARQGKLPNFTGIDDPYEEPLQAEMTLDSNAKTVEQLADEVVAWLEGNQILKID